MTTILVTGGAGYIGSHVCLELLQSGYSVVVIDSLENSTIDSLREIERYAKAVIPFYHARVQDRQTLCEIFDRHTIRGVIHMAGYKSVKESCANPELYYDNNLTSAICLLSVMFEHGCYDLVFSSSATVYGDAGGKCTEDSELSVLNPYGETKLMIEKIMDYAVFPSLREQIVHELTKYAPYFTEHDIIPSSLWRFVSLRYFNPIGAHPECAIGDDPSGIPENLVPYVMKVLSGQLEKLTIYGNDYDTPDGTAIRDYIHIVDLAKAHVKALDSMIEKPDSYASNHERFNIGTGMGYSVLDVVRVFEQILANQKEQIEFKWFYGLRRSGDAEKIYADPSKANAVLEWEANHDLRTMCEDAWSFWSTKMSN